MPKPRAFRLESATARLKLAIRRIPYTGPALSRGIKLLYRRNRTNGTWVVKAASGSGTYWTKGFAQADDFEPADGAAVLTFYQAQEQAKKIARGTDGDTTKPMTVGDALDAYEHDLTSRDKSTANVKRVRVHMTAALAGKPAGLLTVRDLRDWRDSLKDKGLTASTVNRTRAGLRAALELAATLDHRITNRHVFRLGLKGLSGANKARRVILPDTDVQRIVAAAYEIDAAFGLLVEVLAQTGARISQVARLRCADLQADRSDPRILMPTSFKGRGQKEREHVPVPIDHHLALALKQARGNRPHDARLLLKADGTHWQETDKCDHRNPFREAVTRTGLDPDVVTSYSLRHSAIARALLRGVPTSIVARTCDTSSKIIEAHYAAFIADFSDALSRKALLQRPVTDNVVALKG